MTAALISGVAGGCAQVMYIVPLMWLRTIMEYQYKNGHTIKEVASSLYKEGGIRRFYRGFVPAMLLAPTARFGDTAANELALSSLSHLEWPLAMKTFCASVTAAGFRVAILPLDAWKVMKQVHGKAGLEHLMQKARQNPLALWHGGMGVLFTQGFGHYQWFYTNNLLRETVPEFDMRYGKHVRNAFIGFTSSVVADTLCNPIRVLKVNRQTSLTRTGFWAAARGIITQEGFLGLWSRGLKTRILANGIQGSLFTVGWRYFMDLFNAFRAAA
ncbi:Mediator of DNA damage checkpoint protein 1 [Durusdinium trenchii]